MNEPVDDFAPRRITGWIGLLDRVWRLLASPYLTVVLLVWMAVVLALSAIIPQAPPLVEDAVVRSQWLAGVPVVARPLVEQLQPLGLFNLLGSAWLRLPLALLIAHGLVALGEWVPALRDRLGWPGPALAGGGEPPGEMNGPGRSFRVESWPEPGEQTRQHVVEQLQKAGYRVALGAESPAPGFVAWRWRWSWLAVAGVYLGLGLAALGLILGEWLNQVSEVTLEPDKPAPMSPASALNVVLDQVTAAGDDSLNPAAADVGLDVLTGAGESQPLALSLHQSRLWRGMWLTLFDLRPVAAVTATDIQTGKRVLLQPFSAHTSPRELVRLPLAENPEVRFVGVPARNLTVRVDYQSSAPLFSLFFFRGVETRPNQSVALASGDETTFERVRYQVTLDYDARLRVNSTLWWVLAGGGWLLVALSLGWLALAPPVRVRGRVTPTDEGCRVTLTVDTLGGEPGLMFVSPGD